MKLTYNILLGRKWIYDMQVVHLTYHHYLKFYYMGQEVTIHRDQNCTLYYNSLIPHNREEINILTSIISQSTLEKTSTSTSQDNNYLRTLIKGKDIVGCSNSSTPLPLSSKYSKQSPYEKIYFSMKDLD